jgi:hypothetical protein|tara:strand:+ start:95 stop:292 length:198 start_codon:yes stop_codon:yes gene_type:complete
VFDFLLAFCLGYIFRSLLIPRQKYDVLLQWDNVSLGWRPIMSSMYLDSEKKYMAAIEVDPKSWSP